MRIRLLLIIHIWFLIIHLHAQDISKNALDGPLFSLRDSASFELKWVVDTNYTNYFGLLESNIVLYSDKESIQITDDGVEPYYHITDHVKNLVQVENQVYYYTESKPSGVEINIDQPIDLNLSNIKKNSRTSYKINYPEIVYAANDSVFVDNFQQPGRRFLTRGSTVMALNDGYAWIPSKGRYFLYNVKDKELKEQIKPAPYYGLRDFNNQYVLPYYEKHETVSRVLHIYDLDYNSLISPDQGYTRFCATPNLLILYGSQRPTIGIYKGKIHTLPYTVKEAKVLSSTTCMLLTDHNDKLGVVNSEMELIHPFEYDKCYDKPYTLPHFVLKNVTTQVLGDGTGSPLLNQAYTDIEILDEDRLKVTNEDGVSIIDFKGNTIIPNSENGIRDYSVLKVGLTKSLVGSTRDKMLWLYTYDGAFIDTIPNSTITVDRKQEYFHNKHLVRVQETTIENAKKMNPSLLWLASDYTKKGYPTSLSNYYGELVVDWNFKSIYPIVNNCFLVRTQSNKLGVVKYVLKE